MREALGRIAANHRGPRQSQLPRSAETIPGLSVERPGRVGAELALRARATEHRDVVVHGQEREPAFAGLALFSALLAAEHTGNVTAPATG